MLAEHVRIRKTDIQRRRIFALVDRGDRLPGTANAVDKVPLRHSPAKKRSVRMSLVKGSATSNAPPITPQLCPDAHQLGHNHRCQKQVKHDRRADLIKGSDDVRIHAEHQRVIGHMRTELMDMLFALVGLLAVVCGRACGDDATTILISI